jgi:hypothetical protein
MKKKLHMKMYVKWKKLNEKKIKHSNGDGKEKK